MIDICDYAVGLSRQLFGLTIATERPEHRMMETWQPLGVVGVISAFNFPVAVWSWNAALALVCGDPVVWKPSEKTPLTALAVQALFERAAARFGDAPPALRQVLIGGREVGEALVDHPRVPLVSATGSTRHGSRGRPAARGALRPRPARARRQQRRHRLPLGRSRPDRAARIAFAAMGTAGQRCTTLRRLFVHESVYDALVAAAEGAPTPRVAHRRSARRGNPGRPADRRAAQPRRWQRALDEARAAGGRVNGGERVEGRASTCARPWSRCPVRQTWCCARPSRPILYVMSLSRTRRRRSRSTTRPRRGSRRRSSPSTCARPSASSPRAAPTAASPTSTSGPPAPRSAGAFGGEKETGGGREAGSDAWKAYMRRATNTVNYGAGLPLAQGVTFEL